MPLAQPTRTGPGWPHRLYRLLMRLALGPLLLWLWWRGVREPAYRQGLAQRLGHVQPQPGAHGGLWLHAASVGEAQAALRLWPALAAQWGAHAITWTTQTPAGLALLRERLGPQAQLWLAPIDSPGAVRRFLRRVQPRQLLLMERELWPEWLWQCAQQGIAVAVLNARLTARSARRWPYRTHWMQAHLQRLALVLAADDTSLQTFAALGLPPDRLQLTGNLKFELPAPTDTPALRLPVQQRTVIVAASTHADDETLLREGWPAFAAQHPQALLVLAPRHPQRFDEVARQWQGVPLLRRSQRVAPPLEVPLEVPADIQVLLLDSIGELAGCFAGAQLCLMGGTWAPVGGHNALEALAQGCPVLFGPHTHQFAQLYEAMAEAGAARRVDAQSLWATVQDLLRQPATLQAMGEAARRWVQAEQGALSRTLQALARQPAWPLQPMAEVQTGGDQADGFWFDPALSGPVGAASFDPAHHGDSAHGLATGSGRGQALRVTHQGHEAVLRHYRRGGLVARFNPDRYPAAPVAETRAMQEFSLLREMRSLGLPVPRPIAARCVRTGAITGTYRADILVECIAHARNLAQCLDTQRLPPAVWHATGAAIARLHGHGIDHTDLNCHNLLLDGQDQVWLIDFDKCGRRAAGPWREGNLQRLLRSLRKESARRPGFQWHEEDWAALLAGYRSVPQPA